MPRKGVAKNTNSEKFKKLQEYANKLQTKNDDVTAKIKELYEKNVWDLKENFENLQEEFNETSNKNKDIAWILGVQYMDSKKTPRIPKKISLKKFMEGEYKTLFVEKPNTIPTEANYAKRIQFYTRTFEPFKKYEGRDDISWVVTENHRLLYEVIRYNNEKKNVFMSLNKDMKTILRTIRLHLGNTHELTYKFSALSTALSDLASSDDDDNKVATDRELRQYILYEQLVNTTERLEAEYEAELNKLPAPDRKNGDKHPNYLFHIHQLHLLVALYVYDFPSRAEKLELTFITDEKEAKPGNNYILVRDKLDCKMILNEVKKLHKPLTYNISTKIPALTQLNKKLNKLIKKSYKTYPRKSVFLGKTEWNTGKKPVTAGTAANWLSDIFVEKNLSVNGFRSSFVSYYMDKVNNAGKKLIAERMRTSVMQLDQAYRKIVKDPVDLARVKIEPDLELEARASVGTSKDTAYRIGDDKNAPIMNSIRPAIPISQGAAPAMKPKPMNTHERKRINFQTYYAKVDKKKHHQERVKKHSALPSTYAKRAVRELNSGMIDIKNLKASTIAKYGIKKDGSNLWTYNLPE